MLTKINPLSIISWLLMKTVSVLNGRDYDNQLKTGKEQKRYYQFWKN